MDLTPLQLAAPDLAADTIVLGAPETRIGAAAALQVLLELLPDVALPVPLDPPQLATALPLIAARNGRDGNPFEEVPAVLASSVLIDASLLAARQVLAEHGGPWGLVVQTDPRFRSRLPDGLAGHAQLGLELTRDPDGRWSVTVLHAQAPGLAGRVVPLHTATREQR